MTKNILNQYLPQKHPTKEVFRNRRIPVGAVAKFLGLSTNYTCSILNGFARATPEVERKLSEFAELVAGDAAERS